MKKEIVYCDLCGYQFDGLESWDNQPCRLDFLLASPPRQQYESSTYEHLCFKCVKHLKESFLNEVSRLREIPF